MFDGKSINMDVCPRSGSADSLRTTGHSRSVSHDSYFDLLQSPLRGLVTCPSRELSELGINFDREEPEMRIFSESESLVSSPKVAKEVNYLVGGFFSRFLVIFLFSLLVSSTNDTCATRRLCQ
jgi:Rho GTPase-activating protein 32